MIGKVYFTNPTKGDLEKIRIDSKYDVTEVITDVSGNIKTVICWVSFDD